MTASTLTFARSFTLAMYRHRDQRANAIEPTFCVLLAKQRMEYKTLCADVILGTPTHMQTGQPIRFQSIVTIQVALY